MEDIPPASLSVHYEGRTGEIFGLSLRVGFLTIITLGIYRFWATTRVRRWFWSQVLVGDARLEYSGAGFELFVAFIKVALLLALILIPLRLAINFYGPSTMGAGILSFVQLLVLGVLYVFAIYYARRYRLTRTQWHGIRANLVGSSLEYLKLNVGYLLLTWVTLGVAYPYYRIATARYLLDHTWFGDQKFSCTARARSLMVRWLIYLAIMLALLVSMSFQIGALVIAQKGNINPVTLGQEIGELIRPYILAFVALGFYFITYRAAEFRVLVGGLTFQNVRVSSDLGGGRMILFMLKLYGIGLIWGALIAVGIAAIAAIISHLFGIPMPTPGHTSPAIIFGVVLIVVLYLLFLSVFARAYYYNGLLRRVIGSLSFAGAPDLARIGQTTAPIPRWGEGMLEAFDFTG